MADAREFRVWCAAGAKGVGKSYNVNEFLDFYAKSSPNRKIIVYDAAQSTAFHNIRPITMDELIEGRPHPTKKGVNLVWGAVGTDDPNFLTKNKKRVLTVADDWELKREVNERTAKAKEYKKRGLKVPNTLKPRKFSCAEEKTAYYLYKYSKNCFLVYDELTTWLNANPPNWFVKAVSTHRNDRLDILIIVHGFKMIPPKIRPHIDEFLIFDTFEEGLTEKWFINSGFRKGSALYAAFERARKKPYHKGIAQIPEIVSMYKE
jgi:hypothetical protein